MNNKEKQELAALEALQGVENLPKYLITSENPDGTHTIENHPIQPPLKPVMTTREIQALPVVEKWITHDFGKPEDYQQTFIQDESDART